MMRDGIVELGTKRGKCLGFTPKRFEQGSYLFIQDGYLMVSFIISKKKGSFRRMIERAIALGYGIKIPTPLAQMKSIVEKNNYIKTYEPHDDPELGMVEVWVMEAPKPNEERTY